MFRVPLHRASQHRAFHVATGVHAVIETGGVIHTRHVLFDDGAFVQLGGHVVRSSADELDAPVMRLLVRPCALETRQE